MTTMRFGERYLATLFTTGFLCHFDLGNTMFSNMRGHRASVGASSSGVKWEAQTRNIVDLSITVERTR